MDNWDGVWKLIDDGNPDRGHYREGFVLGQGGFGVVKRRIYKSGICYALKTQVCKNRTQNYILKPQPTF